MPKNFRFAKSRCLIQLRSTYSREVCSVELPSTIFFYISSCWPPKKATASNDINPDLPSTSFSPSFTCFRHRGVGASALSTFSHDIFGTSFLMLLPRPDCLARIPYRLINKARTMGNFVCDMRMMHLLVTRSRYLIAQQFSNQAVKVDSFFNLSLDLYIALTHHSTCTCNLFQMYVS